MMFGCSCAPEAEETDEAEDGWELVAVEVLPQAVAPSRTVVPSARPASAVRVGVFRWESFMVGFRLSGRGVEGCEGTRPAL